MFGRARSFSVYKGGGKQYSSPKANILPPTRPTSSCPFHWPKAPLVQGAFGVGIIVKAYTLTIYSKKPFERKGQQ